MFVDVWKMKTSIHDCKIHKNIGTDLLEVIERKIIVEIAAPNPVHPKRAGWLAGWLAGCWLAGGGRNNKIRIATENHNKIRVTEY